MTKDPLGLFARMNALSLMLITPEFYRIRRLRRIDRTKSASEATQWSMQPERMQLGGLDIRFARKAHAQGPTILFLSPLPQSIRCYDAVWAQLSGSADLVALDLPGFGQSAGGKEHMTFAAQSAFLEKFITALDLQDVHIVAPDIALPVALHYAMQPGHRAKSLLVGDGPAILPAVDGSLIRKITGSAFWRMVVRMSGARTFLAGAFQLGYLHYRPSQDEIRDYVDSYSGRIGAVTHYFKHYAQGRKELGKNLKKLTLPIQVFWGDEDAFLPAKNARLLHERLPNSALHIFENCGHFCYQDQSTAFADLIRAWTSKPLS